MPQKIDANDSDFPDLPEVSATSIQRRQRWALAEERHRLNRGSAAATMPPCLDVIIQRPGDAGVLLAAVRLLRFYEAGLPVISDSALLFGERLVSEELPQWDTVIRPGQAVCLTDLWFNRIRPRVSDPNLRGTGDFLDLDHPERPELFQESIEWSSFIKDLEEKMERVLFQGCHIVLVTSESQPEPGWLDMIAGPLLIVRLSNLTEKSLADEQSALPENLVDDRTGEGVFLNPPSPHPYDRPNRTELLDALLLTDVGGSGE